MARFRKNDFFKWAQKIKSVFCFNPYTHEGCDPCRRHKARPIPCFNPHTHEGCDALDLDALAVIEVSIHTPTKGVTKPKFGKYQAMKVSIHTPTKGVTYLDKLCAIKWKFQSTHPRRV